ncbi:MAG: ATP synthase F1 subunit gamma [Rhodobacterales bacterium]|nr:ATP synthase F1 subunit gamma [Rhodobacterales bacterium]
MANLKDIKIRIGSVKKTRQITAAMKLVAGAKLKRATDAALAARPYQEQLTEVLGRVAAKAGDDSEEPLLTAREEIKRILVVFLTSDRGLCGGFNNNLMRKGIVFLDERSCTVDIVSYGKKGTAFLNSRKFETIKNVEDWSKLDKGELVRELSATAVAGYIDGKWDEVWFAFNDFESVLTQTPTFEKMLPLSVEASADDAGGDYRYEPSAQQILGELLPLFVQTLILQKFLETEAGEHASRMTAMDSATRNADDLIDSLSLEYNRARQAAITTEIIEIVSGAAAL